MGTTNESSIFTSESMAGFGAITYGSWTGVNTDWTPTITQSCNNWTGNQFGDPMGSIGFSNQPNSWFWNGAGSAGGGLQYCSSGSGFYCVQQF